MCAQTARQGRCREVGDMPRVPGRPRGGRASSAGGERMKNVPTALRIFGFVRFPVLNFARCQTARNWLKATWAFLLR